jgi:hypothetical protein
LNVPAGTGARAGGGPGGERDELRDQVDDVLAGELVALGVAILVGQIEQGGGQRGENRQRRKKLGLRFRPAGAGS